MDSSTVDSTRALLDQLISDFDFESHHVVVIAAPLARVVEAVETYSLDTHGSPVVRLLVWLRGLGRTTGTFRTWATNNIRCETLSERTTRLSTATRVPCTNAVAYRRFALYWALIKPFSAWIRRDMLRAIERRALRVEG